MARPGKETNAAVQPLSVDIRGLQRVGARPGFVDYLVQVWNYRQFIAYDAKSRVQSGNRRDRLGSAWLILNPVLNGLTYFLIFGLLLNTGGGIENFIGYLVIGIFLFQFSSRSITNGARSIQQNRAVIQAFSFPRATLPISVNLRELLANIPVLIVMMLIVLLVPPTEDITWRWLLIIPALALQWIFNLGVGLILARVVSKVNDVVHLLSFALRAWMYGSAVFYSFERFVDHPMLLQVLELNPLFTVLDIVRDCLLYAQVPSWQSWAVLTCWALGALGVGAVYFWRAEETYGRG
ncbi:MULTISPECIES: ABC transporter permease [unclassified Arthrobacter]|uniref:ABC transporter permease n=1 Tax=unclassified Arthrobacter TaxID=235627 RepID=UPI001E320B8B|nr:MULTISPECIES: ABC transporter permease [unclassified Arthrobacter]MCC9145767.1 ABC transporter permease [Arthrobacter sp. zg-Y919]MDK1276996.1 ABC transporter permease [Arthrobacter sp. zg.Y919]WIB04076.1 ABC transporter permease [Arthrobacter sp. zg-Y919]